MNISSIVDNYQITNFKLQNPIYFTDEEDEEAMEIMEGEDEEKNELLYSEEEDEEE